MRHLDSPVRYLLVAALGLWLAGSWARGGEAKGGAKADAGETALMLAPEDTIILDFSTYAGQFLQYYLINALGAFRGFQLAADNREGVEAAVRLDAEKNVYTIEAALPLAAKAYDFTKEKALSFNLMRDVYTTDSFAADVLIGWAPIFATAQDPASRGFILMK